MVTGPALAVLLSGPSGAGKSHVARRSGLPVVSLDSFYLDGDDPAAPRVDGRVDWDSPESWDADGAVQALYEIATRRRAEVPTYDLASDRRRGSRPVEIGSSPAFVAEGIFAAEIIGACRDRGILADALCLRQASVVTFYRRFARDVAEARKPVRLLARRGLTLLRQEATTVDRQVALGAHPCAGEEALFRIRLAAHAQVDDRQGWMNDSRPPSPDDHEKGVRVRPS